MPQKRKKEAVIFRTLKILLVLSNLLKLKSKHLMKLVIINNNEFIPENTCNFFYSFT